MNEKDQPVECTNGDRIYLLKMPMELRQGEERLERRVGEMRRSF